MTIAVGQRLPEHNFRIMTGDGPRQITTAELFGGRKVVLFGVPGAFTPTCHLNHLPGFLENLSSLRAKGVDEVAVVSVNDVWVMAEWARATKAEGKMRFLADGSAEFTRACGLESDLTVAGMGIRSKRYSMIVADGVVRTLNIEEARGKVETSGAERILTQLQAG